MVCAIPLADMADRWLNDLAKTSGSAAMAAFDGATLLGERAMLSGFHIPGRISAGGGCRLYDARGGMVALNLARVDDIDLLPALFEVDTGAEVEIARLIARCDVAEIVARGRTLGLAIAGDHETPPAPAVTMTRGPTAPIPARPPRVLDLSALWAGPLAAHLLWLAGAAVTKVESASRPDAMRDDDTGLFALLDQGKTNVVLELRGEAGRATLLDLIALSDIVIEAARPRALAQLGIHADAIVQVQPGLTWLTLTGHGTTGDAAHWVGFGDDCGVAGGLTAALRHASGRTGFVGDAIADPLTGIFAARAAWESWTAGGGTRLGIAMSGVVASAIAATTAHDLPAFMDALVAWASATSAPFPPVTRRGIGARSC